MRPLKPTFDSPELSANMENVRKVNFGFFVCPPKFLNLNLNIKVFPMNGTSLSLLTFCRDKNKAQSTVWQAI